jgi:ribonucleoside-diphosphate reductase alpha chain
MPELQLQQVKRSRGRPRKETNGHANGKLEAAKIRWQELPHKEKVNWAEKLAGPRPEIPTDVTAEEWSEQALRVLRERYFLKDNRGEPMEDVAGMCWRVAWELARGEVKYGATREQVTDRAREFYTLMYSRRFLPNSPTLMNAGKDNGLQYSACYVLPVPDSLEGIFDGIKYQGLIHQSGGGTGFSFSRLRPAGARVKSSMGVASGPVSFMRIYNEATQQIKQGGTRRGANMGILRIDHPDILAFIHCKDDGKGITNFNISVTVTDEFMQALADDREYELKAPRSDASGTHYETAGKLSAREVWEEIAQSAWKTGDPGLVFIDRINRSPANPIRMAGWEIESTNPCVTGDTLVSTKEGLVRIGELAGRKDVEVLVDGRLGDQDFMACADVFKTGRKTIYELLTEEGYRLKLTGDHKVLTDSGWKEASRLAKGEMVLVVNRKGSFGKEGNLETGQVLGWLVGDGTIKATEAVLSFFGREKKVLAPYFAQLVEEMVAGEQKLQRYYSVSPVAVLGRDEVRVKSARLMRVAKAWGLVRENKLMVPEKVLVGTEEMQRGFLQALFTADGHVEGMAEKGVSVRLTSKSLELLTDVQRLLLNFGIVCKIFTKRRRASWRSLPDGKGGSKEYYCHEYHDLVVSKDNLWRWGKEIGFLVDYKNDDLLLKLSGYKEGPYQEGFTAKVADLMELGKEEVYDLVEPETHSFVANGLVVHNCGEQPLYPFDACNLGSIFLNYYVKNGKVDWEELGKTVRTSVRLLDDVIEMNPFPLLQIKDTVNKIRRIGLGVGGWADMLVKLGIPYDSEEALKLAEKVMKFINDKGHKTSAELARERGAFPLVKASIYNKHPMRNSTVTTIAPTGSIGILANTSGGIEPLFAVAYRHIVKSESRELMFVNPLFEQVAKTKGFYSEELMSKVAAQGTVRSLAEIPEEVRRVFGTAHEIAPEWHVRMQAAFQKYTDNGVSKTINLPHEATPEDIKRAYMLAWETDCRGITVFRDGSKSEQVLNLGTHSASSGQAKKEEVVEQQVIRPRPVKVEGATYRIETPLGIAFITVNHDGDGNPFEVFVMIGKAGSEVAAMAEAIGRLISTTLRFGNHLPAKERAREVMTQLQGIGGGRSVGFGPNRVRSLPDAVARAIGMHFGLIGYKEARKEDGEKAEAVQSVLPLTEPAGDGHTQMSLPASSWRADICPSCGEASLVSEEGCKKCYGCGYSEC